MQRKYFYEADYEERSAYPGKLNFRGNGVLGLSLFQEIKILIFEKTSGSDIDVCFVSATIKKKKKKSAISGTSES